MGQLLLILAVALVVGVIVFGVAVLITGSDSGLEPAEPDASAVPLPTHRPLGEGDLSRVRFDLALRGYRMAQVDQAMRRAAYDIGYKDELIGVLEAEVVALRAGRQEEAEALRRAREAALIGTTTDPEPAGSGEPASEIIELGPTVPVVTPPRSGPVADLVPGATPVPERATDVAPATDAEPPAESEDEKDSDEKASDEPAAEAGDDIPDENATDQKATDENATDEEIADAEPEARSAGDPETKSDEGAVSGRRG